MRQSVIHSINAMFQIDPIKTLPTLAPLAQDDEACACLWTPSILASKECVEILSKSVDYSIRKRGVGFLSVLFNSLNDFVSVMHRDAHHA